MHGRALGQLSVKSLRKSRLGINEMLQTWNAMKLSRGVMAFSVMVTPASDRKPFNCFKTDTAQLLAKQTRGFMQVNGRQAGAKSSMHELPDEAGLAGKAKAIRFKAGTFPHDDHDLAKKLPSLELTYFDTGGRAEPIRLILTYGGIDFADVRIKDFPAKKPSLDLPFGQVPTLHVDGKAYAQSIAIARYAATLAGLYPINPLEALEADQIVDSFVEATTTFVNAAFMEPDKGKRTEMLADANDNVLPRLLGGLEKRAVGPFFLGPKPSFADIYALDFHEQIWTAFPSLVKMTPGQYPKLAAIARGLRNSAELAPYFKPTNDRSFGQMPSSSCRHATTPLRD